MEKRRVRLEINGVVCRLITQESDEYMRSLVHELEELLEEIQLASPYITREAAALTAALSYCDDARKNAQQKKALRDRVDELEVEAEVWHEERADMVKNGPNPETQARIENLERRNAALQEIAGEVDELRRRAASLEKENQAQAAAAAQLPQLRQALERLEEENRRLRQGASLPPEGEALLEELEKLAAENARLRRDLEEAEAGSGEEDQPGEPDGQVPEGQTALPGMEPDPAPQGGKGAHKRKNPLRHEEEFQQEGFVSFFEKK